MARMYGKFDRTHQNSRGWTKAAMRHDEERQDAKDVEAETTFDQDCPHELGLFDIFIGIKSCLDCYCLANGLDPEEVLNNGTNVW